MTKNNTGINKSIWCPIAPKKFFGEILNSDIELVLSEDWNTNDANSFW